jgi:hypothetical protein
MTASTHPRTFTATAAARAAGVPVRVLERIAQAMPPVAQPDRLKGQWRRPGLRDVGRYAVAGRGLSFGLTVQEATAVVALVIDPRLARPVAGGLDLPDAYILRRLQGLVCVITRNAAGRLNIRETDHLDAEAGLVLRIGEIVAGVIERLAANDTPPAHGTAPGSVVKAASLRVGRAPMAVQPSAGPFTEGTI